MADLWRLLDPAAINRRASAQLAVDPFGRNAEIRRYECGYFDAGARRLDRAAPIQTACFLHYVTQSVGHPERNRRDPTDGPYKAGWARAVPAGVSVKADHGWPEAMRLCAGKPGCGHPIAAVPPPPDGSPRSSIGDQGI